MTPAGTSGARRDARRAERLRRERQDAAIARTRLLVFLAVPAAWWFLGWAAAAVPAAGFVVLLVAHARVIAARDRAARAEAFHERALARLEGRPDAAPEGGDGARFRDPHHPFADDLDLFGPSSLFARLSAARTGAGEEALAAALRTPVPTATVRERQDAVRELAPALDLREDLALLGEELRTGVDRGVLTAWAEAPATSLPAWGPGVAVALSALTAAALGAWAAGWGPHLFLLAAAAQGAFAWALHRKVAPVLRRVEAPADWLDLLSGLTARLGRERPRAARLRRLHDDLGEAAPAAIRALERRVAILDSRRNQLFAPLAGLALLGTHLAYALERWRARHGAEVRRWLDAVGELEALLSVAAYAWERPADAWPEAFEDGPALEARRLGHPLLPDEGCVRNDVALGGAVRLLVISGSNMSGKSTLLRAVGTSVCLAWAGAPVRAEAMRLSPLGLGASLATRDSLQEGTSRFYAEILRLQQVAAASEGPVPLLFLLDEILGGTNSHDRRAGAEALVRALLDRGAIGMITTHDLALTAIVEGLDGRAANVHFGDRVEDGRIVFDYTMRPGVVGRGNALLLMRQVGLPV